MIEVDLKNNSSTWKYALARMHRYELDVTFDNAPIHQFRALTSQEIQAKVQPYTVFRTMLSNPDK